MPYEPLHTACRIPPLLSTEKPDFESSGSKEERDAGDARAGTPPHQVPGDCQGQEGLECELGMEEMLSRVHLPILRQAITELAADSEKDKDDQEKEKYGQKIGMGNILTRTIKSMKGMYAEAMEDEKAAELDRFHDAYKFRSHELYASARSRAIYQSMTKARRPSSLPDDAHLQKLKSFIAADIARITTGRQVKVEECILLRSLVVSRLTLFNGRRGASTDAPKWMGWCQEWGIDSKAWCLYN